MAIYYGDGSNSSSGRIIQVQKSIYTGTIAYHSIAQGAETNIPFVWLNSSSIAGFPAPETA